MSDAGFEGIGQITELEFENLDSTAKGLCNHGLYRAVSAFDMPMSAPGGM